MAPTKEEWHAHKDVIREVFLSHTLAGTIEHMHTEYGFTASKTEYERKLRSWKVRKNVRNLEHEWLYILETKRMRDKAGKSSVITLLGKQISEKAIRKQMSRYTLSQLQQMPEKFAELGPYCPESITIRTPGTSPASIPQSLSPEPLTIGVIEVESQDIYELGSSLPDGELSLPSNLVTWAISHPVQNSWVKKINTDNLPYFGYLDFATSLDFQFESSDQLIYTQESSVSTIPTENFLVESGVSQSEVTWQRNLPIDSVFAPPVFPDHKMVFYLPGIFRTSVPTSKIQIRQLVRTQPGCSMLDREVDDLSLRLERLFGPSDIDSSKEFLHFMIFSRSNAMFQGFRQDILLNWLLHTGRPMLSKIMTIRLLSVRAYFENVIHDSIKEGDIITGREILNADSQRILFSCHPEQRLSVAVALNCVEVVREIVDAMIDTGDNINQPPFLQTYIDDRDIHETPNPVTILGGAKALEVAKILLEAGADVNAPHYHISDIREILSPIQRAVRTGNIALVRLYLQHNADIHQQGTENEMLYYALAAGRSDLVNLLRSYGAHSDLLDTSDLYRCLEEDSGLPLPILDEIHELANFLGVRVRERWEREPSPAALLRDAAGYGYVGVVRRLLLAGVDVNSETNIAWSKYFEKEMYGDRIELSPHTALIAAIECNRLETVKLLLRNGANANALLFTTYGCSALEAAENLGYQEISACLLEYGAARCPPRSEKEQVMELQISAIMGSMTKARALVNNGIDPIVILDIFPTSRRQNVKNSDAVKTLLSVFLDVYKGKPNSRSPIRRMTPLEAIIQVQDLETARNIVHGGAIIDQSAKILTTLCWRRYRKLSKIDRIQMITLLTELATSSTEPSVYLQEIFHCAVVCKDWETIGILAMGDRNVNSLLHTAMHLVLTAPLEWLDEGRYAIVEHLISLGVDVNASNRSGDTPLMHAATGLSDLSIVKLLIRSGARINDCNARLGTTALQAAAFSEYPDYDIIECLINAGADINAPAGDSRGATALQGAAMRGYLRIALFLLEHGADPNAPGAKWEGRTALEGAAEQGNLDMVQLLLNAGASSTESAANLAQNENYLIIADLLREKVTS